VRRVLSALHMFRLGRRPTYMGAEFYTSVPMILGRLSTISSGYPQRDASYPHFYVDALCRPLALSYCLPFLPSSSSKSRELINSRKGESPSSSATSGSLSSAGGSSSAVLSSSSAVVPARSKTCGST
jgi:hypothetical protein